VVDVGDDRQVADVAAVSDVRLVRGCGGGDAGRAVEEGLVVGGHDEPRYRRFLHPKFVGNVPLSGPICANFGRGCSIYTRGGMLGPCVRCWHHRWDS
jgi:hypothetical protein